MISRVYAAALLLLVVGCDADSEPRRLAPPPRAEQLEPANDLARIYAETSRSPQAEQLLTTTLDREMGPATYTVECHGEICAVTPTADRSDWERRLQADPDIRHVVTDILFWHQEIFMRVRLRAAGSAAVL